MKILTPFHFATITQFVLREGDRETYCNRFNDNPHLSMPGFDAYLNPTSPGSISCDADDEFNELVFRDGSNQATIRLVGKELKYDDATRSALERYFATLIAHISQQG